MKKTLMILLSFAMLVTFVGCGAAVEETPAVTTEPKRDYSEFAGIVEDTKSWYDELMAMPIANDDMTEDELRQLAADAFRINLSYTWTPTQSLSYEFTLLERTTGVDIPKGMAYAGMFYNNNNARGNIWKVLPYYDHDTGVVDIEAMGDNLNVLNNMTSACSYGAIQAWNRVSNSHRLSGMNSYNKTDSGIIPVGDYACDPFIYSFNFGSRTASNEVLAYNGKDVIYECYAQMKLADGLYSSSSWHVVMCAENPVIVRDADGKLNPNESYVLVHEQGQTGTKSDSLNYNQPNGVALRPLGTLNTKKTFTQLFETGYIPFTIKEFIGQEPVEPGEAWLRSSTGDLENNQPLTVDEIFACTINGNYNLCNFLVEVKAPDGTVLVSYYPQVMTKPTPGFYSCSLVGLQQTERMAPYADGRNTIHISARLANGELVEAFYTVLKLG